MEAVRAGLGAYLRQKARIVDGPIALRVRPSLALNLALGEPLIALRPLSPQALRELCARLHEALELCSARLVATVARRD